MSDINDHSSFPANLHRCSSDLSDFDPFQVFEVENQPCMVFRVKVLSGRNITKGTIKDLLDTPDPYIRLRLKGAPDGRKQTKYVANEHNPVWNENFVFLLDPSTKKMNALEIFLMESNIMVDEIIGYTTFPLHNLEMNKEITKTFIFNKKSEVDLQLLVKWDDSPTLRYSLCLCDQEKEFRRKRRSRILTALCSRLRREAQPRDVTEVPNIGVLGSGGGFRAMVAMSGVFKALHESGLLDYVMYTAALSGSSWYISSLYSHAEWPTKLTPAQYLEELTQRIDKRLLWLLSPGSLYRYMERILQKRSEGQPVSFTDFFGHLVGETLLKERMKSRLTDQRTVLTNASAPMPLYTCVHVKKDVSAKEFHGTNSCQANEYFEVLLSEWVEFTPFEIGMPKYGCFMPTHLFGSKFFLGKLLREYAEPPLHFLQGIWGSAFCILFNRLLSANKSSGIQNKVEFVREELEAELDEDVKEQSSDSSDSDDDDTEAEKHHFQPATFKKPANSIGNCKRKVTWSLCTDERDEKVEPPRKRLRRTSSRRGGRNSTKQRSFWSGFLEALFNSTQLTSSRSGRAGVIHNPLRGLQLSKTYPISPFTPCPTAPPTALMTSQSEGTFRQIFELHPTDVKRLYVVDAGLTFNSPFPLLLRPQRAMDILLSFDFSARVSDDSPPFQELKLAERWAKLNNVAFPPIDETAFQREGMKEMYVFKHPTNPHCPIVLHFVLVNKSFRQFTKPGILREPEEMDFADFSLFDDPTSPYSTFNFTYSHLATERLSKLCEFNTLKHIDDVIAAIEEKILKKRRFGQRVPVPSNSIHLLDIKRQESRKQLHTYIRRMESVSALPDSSDKPNCLERRRRFRGGSPLPAVPKFLFPPLNNNRLFSMSSEASPMVTPRFETPILNIDSPQVSTTEKAVTSPTSTRRPTLLERRRRSALSRDNSNEDEIDADSTKLCIENSEKCGDNHSETCSPSSGSYYTAGEFTSPEPMTPDFHKTSKQLKSCLKTVTAKEKASIQSWFTAAKENVFSSLAIKTDIVEAGSNHSNVSTAASPVLPAKVSPASTFSLQSSQSSTSSPDSCQSQQTLLACNGALVPPRPTSPPQFFYSFPSLPEDSETSSQTYYSLPPSSPQPVTLPPSVSPFNVTNLNSSGKSDAVFSPTSTLNVSHESLTTSHAIGLPNTELNMRNGSSEHTSKHVKTNSTCANFPRLGDAITTDHITQRSVSSGSDDVFLENTSH